MNSPCPFPHIYLHPLHKAKRAKSACCASGVVELRLVVIVIMRPVFLCIFLFSISVRAFSLSSAFTSGSVYQTLKSPRGREASSRITMIRHGCKTPKLGKPADQRKALLRSLTTELLRHGRIKTTYVRAKAVQPIVDKMITLSKGNHSSSHL